MLRATLKGALARSSRLVMSLVAVGLSVAFVVGTLMLGATMEKTFTDMSAGNVADVTLAPKASGTLEIAMPKAELTPAQLDAVRKVDGVESAEPQVFGENIVLIGRNGKVVGGGGAPQMAYSWLDGSAQHHAPLTALVEGRAPRADGEVTVDEATWRRSGYRIGDTVKVLTGEDTKPLEVTLVGAFRPASGGFAGASVLTFGVHQMQQLTRAGDRYHLVRVSVAPGRSQQEVADRIAAQVPMPAGIEAVTGATSQDRAEGEVADALAPVQTMLLVFAFVSLLVGSFLILNTFRIVVAQRARELALLRAMGASRGQVLGSVVVEALLVGLAGSALGIGLGAALAAGLKALVSAIGLDLSRTALQLPPEVFVWGLAVGVGVTLLGALWPAVRGSRVPPERAMSDVVEERQKVLGLTSGIGAALLAAGLGLTLWAWLVTGARVDLGSLGLNRFVVYGIGAAALLVGAAILSPVIGAPVIAGIGRGYRAAFGSVGRLAETNAVRAPGRTAATAAALMVGVTLVTGFAMIAASFKTTISDGIDATMSRDFTISSPNMMNAFSPKVAAAAEGLDDIEYAVAFRSAPPPSTARRPWPTAPRPRTRSGRSGGTSPPAAPRTSTAPRPSP